MALSKPDDAVSLLYQSTRFFNHVLVQFRICHDLGLTSGMFEKEAMIRLDQCGVKFRQLSSFGATLAEKVASVWCSTCIMFYRNLSKIQKKDPSKILKNIAGNAEQIAQGFAYLSTSADSLTSHFKSLHTAAGVGLPAVQDAFVAAFKEQERKAAEAKTIMQQNLERAKERTEAAKGEVHKRKRWLAAKEGFRAALSATVDLLIHPLSYGTSSDATADPGQQQAVAVAESVLENAKELEMKTEAQLKETQRRFKEQQDQRKKAEVMAGELTKLMTSLQHVSEVCQQVGEYFKSEAQKFKDMSESVSTGEQLKEYGLTEEIAEQESKELNGHKDLLEKYHRVMSVINSSHNFEPFHDEYQFVEIKSLFLEQLGVRRVVFISFRKMAALQEFKSPAVTQDIKALIIQSGKVKFSTFHCPIYYLFLRAIQ